MLSNISIIWFQVLFKIISFPNEVHLPTSTHAIPPNPPARKDLTPLVVCFFSTASSGCMKVAGAGVGAVTSVDMVACYITVNIAME